MTIKIDFRFAKPGQVEKYESIPIVATLKVENTVFLDALDLGEFLKSFRQAGLLPLFTCPVCHTFGCGGCYVHITHTQARYVINGTYTPYEKSPKLISSIRYEIFWWQLRPIVGQIRDAITSIPHKHPHLERYISTLLPSPDEIDEAAHIIQQKSTPEC